MKDKIFKILIGVLLIAIIILWWKNNKTLKEKFQAQQELRKKKIAQDSLVKLSNGYYVRLVADSLTEKQLKRQAEKIIELEGRKPIIVEKIVVVPEYIEKPVDNITVKEDSIYIEDYYPNKQNPFLIYTNTFSYINQEGISKFNFLPITLGKVITEKDNGLYQIDFKGPKWLIVESIDIQAEPLAEETKDNWGTLIGFEYGKTLDIEEDIFEINVYQRYKKFYVGGAISSDKNLKVGLKFEW